MNRINIALSTNHIAKDLVEVTSAYAKMAEVSDAAMLTHICAIAMNMLGVESICINEDGSTEFYSV